MVRPQVPFPLDSCFFPHHSLDGSHTGEALSHHRPLPSLLLAAFVNSAHGITYLELTPTSDGEIAQWVKCLLWV